MCQGHASALVNSEVLLPLFFVFALLWQKCLILPTLTGCFCQVFIEFIWHCSSLAVDHVHNSFNFNQFSYFCKPKSIKTVAGKLFFPTLPILLHIDCFGMEFLLFLIIISSVKRTTQLFNIACWNFFFVLRCHFFILSSRKLSSSEFKHEIFVRHGNYVCCVDYLKNVSVWHRKWERVRD